MLKKQNTFLVTGNAGFIGAALTKKLLDYGENVIGIDNLNDYYDVKLKESRLNYIKEKAKVSKGFFKFFKYSLENKTQIETVFDLYRPNIVVHLAAQAGVRYSITNPDSYFQSNLLGFGNILEIVRKNKVENFIFASSSSVYGGNKLTPFREDHKVDNPVSLYAATKKSNELLAYSYSHLYNIPTTGLRFFTVYGPWGRPDMAPMIFLNSILKNKSIDVFNNGLMQRDFTYIDDIVEGVYRCCYKIPLKEDINLNNSTSAPYRIFNIGNGKPIELMNFIKILEEKLKIKCQKTYLPMQQGDVVQTYADTSKLKKWIGYTPSTSIELGLEKFIKWYKNYYF